MNNDVFVVTGANGGIGEAVLKRLLQKNVSVIMACRNLDKAQKLIPQLKSEFPQSQLELMKLDLASFQSIHDFCNTLKNNNIRPQGLLNNAGVMCRHFGLTDDGFERTLGVNYLGTFLLTRLLLPQLKNDANVVNIISVARFVAHVDSHFFNVDENSFRQIGTYADTKLALTLFTAALSIKTRVKVNAADPGIVNSNMITMHRWYDSLADAVFRPICKSTFAAALPAVNALATSQTQMIFRANTSQKIPQSIICHPNSEWLWETTEQILMEKGCCLPPLSY